MESEIDFGRVESAAKNLARALVAFLAFVHSRGVQSSSELKADDGEHGDDGCLPTSHPQPEQVNRDALSMGPTNGTDSATRAKPGYRNGLDLPVSHPKEVTNLRSAAVGNGADFNAGETRVAITYDAVSEIHSHQDGGVGAHPETDRAANDHARAPVPGASQNPLVPWNDASNDGAQPFTALNIEYHGRDCRSPLAPAARCQTRGRRPHAPESISGRERLWLSGPEPPRPAPSNPSAFSFF